MLVAVFAPVFADAFGDIVVGIVCEPGAPFRPPGVFEGVAFSHPGASGFSWQSCWFVLPPLCAPVPPGPWPWHTLAQTIAANKITQTLLVFTFNART
jgi:hypothetical protein